MAAHPDLPDEQAFLDRAYERLAAMRRSAAELRDSVIEATPGGTHQARVERDVFVQTSLARLEQLELGGAALCFGRIDAQDGEAFHVGRLAISDTDQEPLVVDWRAPIAEAFYRATGRNPMGLNRRRHFGVEERNILSIEDELFGSGLEGAPTDDLQLAGPGALLAALSRSRSGHMRDIVATVQREQDEIIRAELGGVLVVQGGPGTGKTAVALHRAAYLLYTFRFPLENQGVLVVGPNQVFLRYIDQVLPSLGESGVALSTPAGLVADVRPRGVDTRVAARVKGDARMAVVIAKAIADRERGLPADLVVGFGTLSLQLLAGSTAAMAAAVRRRAGSHNARRRQFEQVLFRGLYDAYRAALNRRYGSSDAVGRSELDMRDFTRLVRRDAIVVAALERMWPRLTAEELLRDLFGAQPLLTLAAGGLLDDAERAALARPRGDDVGDVRWTLADLPLIDEARALLGPVHGGRTPDGELDDGMGRSYGHIVVDEAQDLSPMTLRVLARRSISGSMTLVGDIGQATTGLVPTSWDDVLAHLPSRRPPRVVQLTVNYRTPAEIMRVANEVLAAVRVKGLAPIRPVRASGHLPRVESVVGTDLAGATALVAASELLAVNDGTVAVIAPESLLGPIAASFEAASLPWGEPTTTGLSAKITLLDAIAAKGLEFDSVVVVEPAGLVAEADHGLRSLFVALTRPTRRLAIVHAEPLPAPLVAGLAAAEEEYGAADHLADEGADRGGVNGAGALVESAESA